MYVNLIERMVIDNHFQLELESFMDCVAEIDACTVLEHNATTPGANIRLRFAVSVLCDFSLHNVNDRIRIHMLPYPGPAVLPVEWPH